jgi:hypothetical protein
LQQKKQVSIHKVQVRKSLVRWETVCCGDLSVYNRVAVIYYNSLAYKNRKGYKSKYSIGLFSEILPHPQGVKLESLLVCEDRELFFF